jgi:hypothetical protein
MTLVCVYILLSRFSRLERFAYYTWWGFDCVRENPEVIVQYMLCSKKTLCVEEAAWYCLKKRLVHGFVGCCTWATFLLSICLEKDLRAFDGYFLLCVAAISCCTSCVTLSSNQKSCCSFMSVTVCGKGLVTLWSRIACRRSTLACRVEATRRLHDFTLWNCGVKLSNVHIWFLAVVTIFCFWNCWIPRQLQAERQAVLCLRRT